MSDPRKTSGWPRRRWLYGLLLTYIIMLVGARPAALLAIGGYQRFISPHKGYRCAHAAFYSRSSCSEFGRQAVQEHGVLAGLLLLRERLHACHQAAVAIRSGERRLGEPRVDECFESDAERGKREGKETRDYCTGWAEGCCSGG